MFAGNDALPVKHRTSPGVSKGAQLWRLWIVRALLLPLASAATLSLALTVAVHADSDDDRRVRMGARLFRSTLAAAEALETKASADGRLRIGLIGDEGALLDEVRDLLLAAGKDEAPTVRGMPIELLELDATSVSPEQPLAGIFLATRLDKQTLATWITISVDGGSILYSPFDGDVERGATAGLSIEAKVLPYVNQRTLEAAGIELKPLFMKVAKVHR